MDMSVAALAKRIVDSYAHNPEGLTEEKCAELTENRYQAEFLCSALERGEGGKIDNRERGIMEVLEFSPDLVALIAGPDGNAALRERAKWLGEQAMAKEGGFDKAARRKFISELGEMGPAAADEIPELIEALAVNGLDSAAVEALSGIGAVAVPALIEALGRREDWIRANAAKALGEIGRKAADAVTPLRRLLNDEHKMVRSSAAYALGRIGPAAKESVSELIAMIEDRDERYSCGGSAIVALGRIGPDAEEAIPVLVAMLKDRWLCDEAAWALGRIGTKSAPALLAALKGSNRSIRRYAALALGWIEQPVDELLSGDAEEAKLFRAALADSLGDKSTITLSMATFCKYFLASDEETRGEMMGMLKASAEDKPLLRLGRDYLVKVLGGERLWVSNGVLPIWPGIHVSTYTGDGELSFFFDEWKVLGFLPGNPVVRGSGVSVYDFVGQASFRMKKPPRDMNLEVSGLLMAYRDLPAEFFSGIFEFAYLSESSKGYRGAYIKPEKVELTGLAGKDTFVHELVHHWDLTLRPGADLLFNRISWRDVDESRWIHGIVFKSSKDRVPDRGDFDRADFVREYGLCNPNEDLATFVTEYVMNGNSLRKRVRREMGRGNFELAAKYLFAKHMMPFEGREYGVDEASPVLTIEEVNGQYVHAGSRSRTSLHTYSVIVEIEMSVRQSSLADGDDRGIVPLPMAKIMAR